MTYGCLYDYNDDHNQTTRLEYIDLKLNVIAHLRCIFQFIVLRNLAKNNALFIRYNNELSKQYEFTGYG